MDAPQPETSIDESPLPSADDEALERAEAAEHQAVTKGATQKVLHTTYMDR